MTAAEQLILIECQTRQDAIAATIGAPESGSILERTEQNNARLNGPRYVPSDWFGEDGKPLPEAERVRFLRAVHKLASAGFLAVTRNGAGRVERIRLTQSGRAEVGRLVDQMEATSTDSADHAP